MNQHSKDNPQDNGPFEMGYAAWNAGVSFKGNPFPSPSDNWDYWSEGWLAAKADNGRNGVGA